MDQLSVARLKKSQLTKIIGRPKITHFFNVIFCQGLRCNVNSILLHLLAHVSILDDCFPLLCHFRFVFLDEVRLNDTKALLIMKDLLR